MTTARPSITSGGLSLLLLLAALVSSACDSFVLIVNPSSGGTLLRVTNVGTANVAGLVVLFPGERIAFGDLPGHGSTSYRSAAKGVFPYAAYEFQVSGRVQSQPVTDWVGERPMDGEAFTYSIELVEGRQSSAPVVRLVDVRRDR
jgi:hypothetical protein